MKKTDLTADERMQKFAAFCNHFISTNPLQYTIDDVCCYISKVENHNKLRGVDRRQRVPSGVKTLLKYLVALYDGRNGLFVNADRMTQDFFIRTSKKEIFRRNRGMTDATWRRAREIMVKAELLKMANKKIKGAGTHMFVKLDFYKLSQIIGEIDDLKGLRRSQLHPMTVAPEGFRDAVNSTCNYINATRPTAEPVAEITGDMPPSEPMEDSQVESSRGVGIAISDSELRSDAFGAETEPKRKGEKQTIADIGLRQIINMLAAHFARPITYAHVRKIQRLRRRQGEFQMTPERLGFFLQLVLAGDLDPALERLTLERLLQRNVWHRAARYTNLRQLRDVDYAESVLQSVQEIPKRFQEIMEMDYDYFCRVYGGAVFNLCPDADCFLFLPRALKEGLEFNANWVLPKARKQILEGPLLFYTTEHMFPWDILLDLTNEEKDKIRRDAREMIRYSTWVTNLAKHYAQPATA